MLGGMLNKWMIDCVNEKRDLKISSKIFCIFFLIVICIIDVVTGYGAKMASIYIILSFFIAWVGSNEFSKYVIGGLLIARAVITAHEAPIHDIESGIVVVNYITLLIAVVFVYIAVSSLKTSINDILSSSQTDPLTELFSRRYLRDVMPVIISDLKRHGRSLSIMFIDCDNFKEVNDTWGHAAGDTVLRTVSRTILDTIREGDIPVRLGGDEFVVIFLETSGDQLKAVVNRCIAKLDLEMKEREWPITFSVGVVEFLIPPESIEVGLMQADQAMYQAKRCGKNRIVYESGRTV
ncbi:putative GGDEF domain-containing protein [Azospirillaceae bacterium]